MQIPKLSFPGKLGAIAAALTITPFLYPKIESLDLRTKLLGAAILTGAVATYSIYQSNPKLSDVKAKLIETKNTINVALKKAPKYFQQKENSKIIHAFITNPFPSREMWLTIASSSELIEGIIQKGDITKKDHRGKSLLYYSQIVSSPIENIQLLLNAAKWDNEELYDFIRYMITQRHDVFQAVCTKDLLDKACLTPKQQIQLFCKIRSAKEVALLTAAGLDINVSDENGRTPLLNVCNGIFISELSKAELASLLINAGANLYAKARIWKNEPYENILKITQDRLKFQGKETSKELTELLTFLKQHYKPQDTDEADTQDVDESDVGDMEDIDEGDMQDVDEGDVGDMQDVDESDMQDVDEADTHAAG